jgi:hypothetical protein
LIRVAVCGSDEWSNKDLVWDALDRLLGKHFNLTVVCRGHNGVDGFAAAWANSNEQPKWTFFLELDRYGAPIGTTKRVERIVAEARPTHLLVCPGAMADKIEEHYHHELKEAGSEIIELKHKADVIRLVVDNKPKPISLGPKSAA